MGDNNATEGLAGDATVTDDRIADGIVCRMCADEKKSGIRGSFPHMKSHFCEIPRNGACKINRVFHHKLCAVVDRI